jgi:hypothetical protein
MVGVHLLESRQKGFTQQNTHRAQCGFLIRPQTVQCTLSIWHLSPREFMADWAVEFATYSLDPSGENQPAFRATSTEEGEEKLLERTEGEV